jgi:putative oxidoreductase
MSDRAKLQGVAYAALRIVSGALFALHGSQKVLGFPIPAPMKIELASQIGLGGLIELIGGILIALGLFTRPAALICSGTMAVAYFQFHWKLETANWKFLPMVNQGEPAVLYCFIFLVFAAMGAGMYSLDARRGRS